MTIRPDTAPAAEPTPGPPTQIDAEYDWTPWFAEYDWIPPNKG